MQIFLRKSIHAEYFSLFIDGCLYNRVSEKLVDGMQGDLS